MSYILEGLKRLEQKRRQEGIPHPLGKPSDISPRRPSQRPLWLYALIAVLLLVNAGLLIWHPWRGEKRAAARQSAPAQQSVAPVTVAPVTAAPAPESRDQARPADSPTLPKKTGAVAAPAAPEKPQAREARAAPSAAAPAASAIAPPPTRAETRPPPSNKVLRVEELPQAVRSGLPELKMSTHYYSPEKESRFVRINDQTLREGQSAASGLKVEEITPAGAVLSYQGYRFQKEISDNR